MNLKNNYIIIFFLSVVTVALGLISKSVLGIEEVLYNSLSNQLTTYEIKEYIRFQTKWEWVSYIFIPILLVIKIAMVSAVLDIGCFLFGKEIKYRRIFNLVTKAEFIFLLATIIKITWFYFYHFNLTLLEIQYFYPLSIVNLINYNSLEPWFIYPLQLLNLFELVYWIILSYSLDKEFKFCEDQHVGIKIVANSYGVGLIIWTVGVMFFTLNIS